jgi:hypothetical protein
MNWPAILLTGLTVGLVLAIAAYALVTNRWPWNRGDR